MKILVRCLCDPYLHVLSIAALLVWFASGLGTSEATEPAGTNVGRTSATYEEDLDGAGTGSLLAAGSSAAYAAE